MDIETLQKQLEVVANAPAITIGGAFALLIAAWLAVNWLRSQEVRGLRSQLDSWKVRYELAKDEQRVFEKKNITLEKTVALLQKQIETNASKDMLLDTGAALSGASKDLANANAAMWSTISGAPNTVVGLKPLGQPLFVPLNSDATEQKHGDKKSD